MRTVTKNMKFFTFHLKIALRVRDKSDIILVQGTNMITMKTGVTTMLYQITDGTVSVGGTTILSHVDFEIKGKEKVAVVGRNGAGKTTLLRLIAGELELDRDDKRNGFGIKASRRLTIEIGRAHV